MKKTAVYADWDSVEVLKIKHTGYFKFKREKSFTAAYNRIVAFITHYNESCARISTPIAKVTTSEGAVDPYRKT